MSMTISYTNQNGIKKELNMKNRIDVWFYMRFYPMLLWISDVVEGTAIILWWFFTDPDYVIWASNHEGTRCLDEKWQFFERHAKKSNYYLDVLDKVSEIVEKE